MINWNSLWGEVFDTRLSLNWKKMCHEKLYGYYYQYLTMFSNENYILNGF